MCGIVTRRRDSLRELLKLVNPICHFSTLTNCLAHRYSGVKLIIVVTTTHRLRSGDEAPIGLFGLDDRRALERVDGCHGGGFFLHENRWREHGWTGGGVLPVKDFVATHAEETLGAFFRVTRPA